MFGKKELKKVMNKIISTPAIRERFNISYYPPDLEKGVKVSDPEMTLERFVELFVNNDDLLKKMNVVKKDRRERGYFRWKVVQYIEELKTDVYTYDINEYIDIPEATTPLFVYGTLKMGFYNHNRFGFDQKSFYWGEAVLKGALMYDLGSYPCIVLTGKENDLVHGELYEIFDSSCDNNIHNMEVGAGYRKELVDINGISTAVYVYNEIHSGARLIEKGLWE